MMEDMEAIAHGQIQAGQMVASSLLDPLYKFVNEFAPASVLPLDPALPPGGEVKGEVKEE